MTKASERGSFMTQCKTMDGLPTAKREHSIYRPLKVAYKKHSTQSPGLNYSSLLKKKRLSKKITHTISDSVLNSFWTVVDISDSTRRKLIIKRQSSPELDMSRSLIVTSEKVNFLPSGLVTGGEAKSHLHLTHDLTVDTVDFKCDGLQRQDTLILDGDIEHNRQDTLILDGDKEHNRQDTLILDGDIEHNRQDTLILDGDIEHSRQDTLILDGDIEHNRQDALILEGDIEYSRHDTLILDGDLEPKRQGTLIIDSDRTHNSQDTSILVGNKEHNSQDTSILGEHKEHNSQDTSILGEHKEHNSQDTSILGGNKEHNKYEDSYRENFSLNISHSITETTFLYKGLLNSSNLYRCLMCGDNLETSFIHFENDRPTLSLTSLFCPQCGWTGLSDWPFRSD